MVKQYQPKESIKKPHTAKVGRKKSHTPPKFNGSALKNGVWENDPFLLGPGNFSNIKLWGGKQQLDIHALKLCCIKLDLVLIWVT